MQKKPSILFHYSVLNIGGAEKSVLRLTKLLCDRGWDVTLVLTSGGGRLESQVDSRVAVIPLRPKEAGANFKRAAGWRKLLYLTDALRYGIYRLIGEIRAAALSQKRFDMAAVSLQGLNASFVCAKINAAKRLHWIRSDLSQSDPQRKAIDNIDRHHHCTDHYICVSATAKRSFDAIFPHLQTKSLVIPNVIDAEQMRRSTEGNVPQMESVFGLKVVTVCRLFDKAKGLFRMVRVHKRLHEEKIDFHWFVVGDGPDREKMQQAINDAGLQENMILLGSKENPFPYYRAADISATLSYYEGLCGAVNEAKVIGKPVLATEFSGIYDQIEHGVSGWIVQNNEDAIYEGLKTLLREDALRQRLTNDLLPQEIIDDDYKIDMLEALMDKGKEKE